MTDDSVLKLIVRAAAGRAFTGGQCFAAETQQPARDRVEASAPLREPISLKSTKGAQKAVEVAKLFQPKASPSPPVPSVSRDRSLP